MKMTTCPCGAEFKTHTVEEGVEHAILHVKIRSPEGVPPGAFPRRGPEDGEEGLSRVRNRRAAETG